MRAGTVAAAVLVLTLTACGPSGAVATVTSGQVPSASVPASASAAAPLTESNPPGDIPDNQAYVAFSLPSGVASVKVPEGWARATAADGATAFTDKLNSIEVLSSSASAAVSPADARSTLVPKLKSRVPAFLLGDIKQVNRSGSTTLLITYQGDSPPDSVTGKVVRDAFELYLFSHNGSQVDLTLTGPVNADNVDPWRIVSDSITWT